MKTLTLKSLTVYGIIILMAGCSIKQENDIKTNQFLSGPVYGLTHFNPGQTDAFPFAVKKGIYNIDLSKAMRVRGGPVNIMNLASPVKGYMWAISTSRVAYVDTTNGGWKTVSEIVFPGVKRISPDSLDMFLNTRFDSIGFVEKTAKIFLGPNPQDVTSNGLYTVADIDNIVYVNAGTVICAIGLKKNDDPSSGLVVKRTLETKDIFEPFEFPGYGKAVKLIGMSLTYDGFLVIGSFNAVAVVDRNFESKPVVYNIEPGQLITNSFSVDDKNGIYVASGSMKPKENGILRKVIWTGTSISDNAADGAWSSPYDGGEWPPVVKSGTGTGSTPTLMGFNPNDDRLVIITDGSNKMKLVAFWRDEIPEGFVQKPGSKSRRIADQIAINAGLPDSVKWIQSEQSVVASGWGAFVVNNMVSRGHHDKIIDVLTLGPVLDPPVGMERLEWDPINDKWKSVWTNNDEISTSMVPVLSMKSGIVFVNGYQKKSGWEVTGMDWNNGEVVFRAVFGHTNYGNGAYAILQFLENGDLLFNSIGGPFRIPLK